MLGCDFFMPKDRPTIQDIREDCRNNLLIFGRMISPRTFDKPSAKFHTEVTNLLMDRSIVQLCVQAPRGFGKSTLAVIFILHHILHDPGDKVIILQSKTRPEAINRLWKIKNILDYSRNFKDLYGYAGEDSPATTIWREDKIKTRIGGFNVSIRAIGTGQPARGTLESGIELQEDGQYDIGDDTRITLFYLDDPDDEDNTKTKEAMVGNYRKFIGIKEGLDTRTGRVLVVGTPIRQGCITDVIFNSEGWITKKYKAYYPNENDRLLWEEYRDYDWLMGKKKELESVGQLSMFYSEYMCEIVGDEDQLFREEDFRYHDGEFVIKDGLTFLKINGELKPINVYLGIDPASSVKQSADFSVIMPVGFDENKNIYVLDYFHKRVNPLALTEAIIDYVKRFNPQRGHIESVGYQEMLRQTVRQRLLDENLYLPGLELKFNPRMDKSARLETLQPFFAQHRVYIRKEQNDLIDELLMYPRGRHEDLIDGLYYATRKLIVPDHTVNEGADDDKYFSFTYINKNNWLRN